MTKILFVCHGNICRSVMAQCVMQALVDARGAAGRFFIDSAATSAEELGSPIYPPARRELQRHSIPVLPHRARRVTAADYDRFDRLIVMDANNERNLRRILPSDPGGKVRRLLPGREVADPWYTGDFEATWNDVLAGCEALLRELDG